MTRNSLFHRLLSVCLFIFAAFLAANAAEKSAGLRVGASTRNSTALAGVFFQYSFSEHVRITPNIDYFFRHRGADALGANVNMHFPFALDSQRRWSIYPLAGVNLMVWNYSDKAPEYEVSTRSARVGFNLGAGLDWRCSPTMKLMLEAKGVLVRAYSGAVVSIGIGYVF